MYWCGTRIRVRAVTGACRETIEEFSITDEKTHDSTEFGTSKEHVVEILLYAALLSLVVSRLLNPVTEHAADDLVFPSKRWAATLRSFALLILHRLGT